MKHCAVGVCSSPVHCAEIGRCFSTPEPAQQAPAGPEPDGFAAVEAFWKGQGKPLTSAEQAVLKKALFKSAKRLDAPPAGVQQPVYLVATGETHEGRETYTRHEVRPPLCDAEVLYTLAAPEPDCSLYRADGGAS